MDKIIRAKKATKEEHTPIHDRDAEAAEAGLVLIDEFKFPHCAFQLANNEMNVEGLTYAYKKCLAFLGLNKKEHWYIGMTILVCPQWIFIAPIYNPYHLEKSRDIPGKDLENGVPVYLDGYAYSGIMTIQTQMPSWPSTAGKVPFMEHSALEALHIQSTPPLKKEGGSVNDYKDLMRKETMKSTK